MASSISWTYARYCVTVHCDGWAFSTQTCIISYDLMIYNSMMYACIIVWCMCIYMCVCHSESDSDWKKIHYWSKNLLKIQPLPKVLCVCVYVCVHVCVCESDSDWKKIDYWSKWKRRIYSNWIQPLPKVLRMQAIGSKQLRNIYTSICHTHAY